MKRIQNILLPHLVLCLLIITPVAQAQDPQPKPTPREVPIAVEYLLKDSRVPAGQKLIIRFKLIEKSTKAPVNDLKDARTLIFLAPGIWQKRGDAVFIADGMYEFEVTPPDPGIYMIFVSIPSRNLQFRDLPSHRLEVVKP